MWKSSLLICFQRCDKVKSVFFENVLADLKTKFD